MIWKLKKVNNSFFLHCTSAIWKWEISFLSVVESETTGPGTSQAMTYLSYMVIVLKQNWNYIWRGVWKKSPEWLCDLISRRTAFCHFSCYNIAFSYLKRSGLKMISSPYWAVSASHASICKSHPMKGKSMLFHIPYLWSILNSFFNSFFVFYSYEIVSSSDVRKKEA